MSRKRKSPPTALIEVDITALTHEGRGLTHIDGKTVFVDGALAGERVSCRYTRIQRHFDEATVVEVLRAAPERVTPQCPHFGVCGGCSLQHLHATAQIAAKQASLADLLTRIGKVMPSTWLPPLVAESWGYRRKARLGVRYVHKKGRTLVGFRERHSGFLADLSTCAVLHPSIGTRLTALATTLDQLSIREQVPQVEIAVGDAATVLVLRVMQPLSAADEHLLLALAAQENWRLSVQEGGVETIRPLSGQAVDLYYEFPHLGLQLAFLPHDFTQVNGALNQLMVAQALELLAIQPHEVVLDLFCGLGNFTLPLAQQAARVIGVEGDAGLVARAQANAAHNQLDNVTFYAANLDDNLDQQPWLQERFTVALLDPPRSGAQAVLEVLPRLGVERLVYVSCNPATLARDAAQLVSLGYRLHAAGVMDMFPHTAHVESMALFYREHELSCD